METLTVKLSLDDSEFTSKMSKATSEIGKVPSSANGATASIKNTAAGMLLAKGATAGLSMVMGQMGDAIARTDKLNSFPKTLKLMGISAKDAQSSTNQLKNGIQGLPTTLQDVTGSTQRLVSSGLKIGEATKMTLALNDAMLANGSSTEEAQNAMTQYSQIIATGKVDQQSWNSLVVAMPSALKKVSTELLGAGKSQADLKDALQSGKVSMEDFNNAMMKADKGTQGFHEQAKTATQGIGTGFQNMKTRITAGLASALDSLNKFISAMTGSGIGDIFGKIGTVISDGLSGAGKALEGITPTMQAFGKTIGNIAKTIGNNDMFKALGASIGVFVGGLTAAHAAMAIWSGAVKVATAVQAAFNAVMALNPFVLIAIAIAAVVAGLVYFFTQTKTGQKIWQDLSTTVGNFFSGIGNWIGQAVGAIGNFFSMIGQFFAQIGASISAFLAPIVTVVQNIIQVIVTIIQTAVQIVITIIQTIVTTIVGIIQVIVAIIQATIEVIVAIVQAIVSVIVTLIQAIIQHIQMIIQTIITVMQQIMQAIMQFLQPIIQFIQQVIQQVMQIIQTGIQMVVSIIRSVIATIVAIMNAIRNAIVSVLTPIIQTVSNIFTNVVNAIRTIWNTAVSIVSGIARNIVNGLSRAFSSAVSTVRGIFNRVKNSVTQPLKSINLFNIGANIINGLVNGIQSVASKVKATISGIADGIKSTIKGAMNINSPSRWMRDEVGVFIPQGLAVGIDRDAHYAYTSAEKLAQGVKDATTKTMGDFSLFDLNNQKASADIELNGSSNLIGTLQQLSQEVQKGQRQSIYLDGTTLVGQTTNRIDKNLGDKTSFAGRYNF